MLYDGGAMALRAHQVGSLADRVVLLRRLVWFGEQAFDRHSPPVGSLKDPRMRQIGLAVTQVCQARNDMCELGAIFDFTKRNVRYTGDITNKDTFQTAFRTLQLGGGDCLPLSTRVLRDDYSLVPFGQLVPGDRIMEDGRWTKVTEKWITGEKPILAFDLGNGSTLRCSPTHRLFLLDGTEIRAKDVTVGARLRTPREALPTDEAARTPTVAGVSRTDFAWLLGVYIADGWHEVYRFAISGRDGKPKEAQKRRVETLMQAAGLVTRWHPRYIAVNDKDLTAVMAECGGHAPEKHLPTLALTKAEVTPLLEGLRADAATAKSGTIVHGTTSPLLALQLRTLYRMLGQSTHIRRVDDHGGLGKNPIYRVTVRRREEEYERQQTAVRDGAKVKAIRRERPELCADITTETGRFWLPESDVLVHNCDDMAVLNAVLAMENGFTTKFRITSNTGATWDHIYCLAGVPKMQPRKWVALDTTLPGQNKFTVEPPRAKKEDFDVTEPRR